MENNENVLEAQKNYKVICDALDEIKWKYERSDEDYMIKSSIVGDDLPIEFIIRVIPDNHLISFTSFLPFAFGENKRTEGAIATTVINNDLIDGSFDYDILTGRSSFRLTSSYLSSTISTDVIKYIIIVSSKTVDKYNDRLLMISTGALDIGKFIDDETKKN